MDSNSLMYGAFAALFFRTADVSSEEDTAIMNAAWQRAKENNFAPLPVFASKR